MYSAYNGYSNPAEQAYGRQQFLTKTYGTMALGLLITFATAWAVARFFPGIAYNTFVVFALLIAELAIVWSFSRKVQTASYQTVMGMFIFYAALTGVTFSAVFLCFDMNSIFLCFLMSAAAFGIMALRRGCGRFLGPKTTLFALCNELLKLPSLYINFKCRFKSIFHNCDCTSGVDVFS